MLLACFLVLGACSRKSPNLESHDPKSVFLEQNFPKAKVVRDEIAAQINNTNVNIGNLVLLKRKFTQQEAINIVQQKINHLCGQRDTLWHHLNKIDNELEKGMAMQAFNNIDGGGVRALDLQQTLSEAQACTHQARNINSRVSQEMGYSSLEVPRAVPVR